MILLTTQRVGIYGNVEVYGNADFAQMTFCLREELGTHIFLLAAASVTA